VATTDAINTDGNLVAIYDELIVNIGPEGGEEPGETETFEDVYCTRVVQSAGGSRMDYAELVYGLKDHLQDRDQPSGFSRRVHVRMPDENKTLLADGDYVSESASVQQSGETLTATAQQRQYFFGHPLKYYDVHSPLSDLNAEIEDDIIFNPVVDDKTVFNMSDLLRPGETFFGRLWTHPEMADTTTGEGYQEQVREEWTLKDAVESICELLNPNEEFVWNPTSLEDVIEDAPPLRAVTIPLGTYLPQALDLLLIPLGYNWFVDYDYPIPRIVIFGIGKGEEKTLCMQRVGESLNLEWSNLNQFQISNSIGDSFNDVLAMGQFEEAEFTFPLFPGWQSSLDSTSLADLNKNAAGYDGKEAAWRLWIANEAGDINPSTTRLGQTPTVPDLRAVFTKYIPHRRTIGEPLTFLQGMSSTDADETQRRPVLVEYSVDGGTTWEAMKDEWSVKLCPNQIGILFDSEDVPEELHSAASLARVRITGTIFGDARIQYRATKEDWAVNGRTVQQVIKRPEKFQKRWRQATGTYASVLTGPADEKDDSTEIETFAKKLRDQNHYAEVDCEFRLPGWHLEYKIGDLISKIEGREINLDGAPSNAPDYRFPQIVERRFEMTNNGPSTVLIVDRGVQQS
jgi:hypothetical protein